MQRVSLSLWERGRGEGFRRLGVKALIRPAVGRPPQRPSIVGLWPVTFSRGEKG